MSDPIHLWVKGFRPPSKCPECTSLYTLVYTGERTEGDLFHVYHCERCGARVASPTFYAHCASDNSVIERDGFYSPCRPSETSMCPRFTPLQESPRRCMHIKPTPLSGMDRSAQRKLEKSEIKVKADEKANLELYRRKRLRRLEED